MPWKLDGTFQRINTDFNTGDNIWQQDQQAGIKIIAARHDTHDEDLALGIQECLNTTGLNHMLADLDMNGNRIINLGAGGSTGDLATFEQLIDGASFDTGLRELTLSRPIGDFPPILIPAGDTSSVEGSWTPAMTGATSGSEMNGWYIRDGRLVRLFGYVQWIQRVASTNPVRITGLPFSMAQPKAGMSRAVYLNKFFPGDGMAVSGINSQGGGEAAIQGIVRYENDPQFKTLQLATYIGTNNIEQPPQNPYPYLMNTLSNSGRFGFNMTYLTND